MHPIFKYIFYTFLLSSYKSLPTAYFFRFYWQVLQHLVFPMFLKSYIHKPTTPFETQTINTYNSPFECDGYFHKSNSTYFEELDISRLYTMATILQQFFLNFKTESGKWAYVPVANVFSSFKREIKPYQRYSVKSRVIGWDSKWIFVLSKFVSGKDGQVLHATSVTKYVLKDGRKTIRPVEALKFTGYDVEKYEEEAKRGVELVDWFVDTAAIEALDI